MSLPVMSFTQLSSCYCIVVYKQIVKSLNALDRAGRFGMANRKPTGFDSAVVTSSGRFTLHSIQLFRA